MNNEAAKTAKETSSEQNALIATGKTNEAIRAGGFKPVLVEAEKMFERLADLTRETAHKAYEFFERRGGEFGKDFDDWLRAESEVLLPVTAEITETAEQINVRAAVPGFKPEEIKVSVKDNVLILSGETEAREKREDENTVYSEWRSNKFCRQFTLSSEIEAEKVEATLKDGVLQLTLPKAPTTEAKQIPVNAG
jgi:HSP20 family protein